ncbi:4767_t:CDS:2 [Funneliformis geosporum]|uniref:7302_t:CDS:1 n=1 Tax=Funneliformis geosporum TaxID=1117311 RepID=A0A9W4SFA7_9GLOM|nr:4767_t:CDS:2 [Funneliformis geosporum]CAI2165017.1 7302_t:CDS:2 [Funneliformis geosporum]
MAEKTFETTEPSDHVTNEKTLSFTNKNTSFLLSDNNQFNKNSQLNSTFDNVNYFEKQSLVKESNYANNRVKEVKDKDQEYEGRNKKAIQAYWDRLVRNYKNFKNHNDKTDNNRMNFKFEDEMNDIFGDDLMIVPHFTLDSLNKKRSIDVIDLVEDDKENTSDIEVEIKKETK